MNWLFYRSLVLSTFLDILRLILGHLSHIRVTIYVCVLLFLVISLVSTGRFSEHFTYTLLRPKFANTLLILH